MAQIFHKNSNFTLTSLETHILVRDPYFNLPQIQTPDPNILQAHVISVWNRYLFRLFALLTSICLIFIIAATLTCSAISSTVCNWLKISSKSGHKWDYFEKPCFSIAIDLKWPNTVSCNSNNKRCLIQKCTAVNIVNAPFYDHYTNRNILPDSFKVRSVQNKVYTTNVEILNGSKWTVILEWKRSIWVNLHF